MESAAGVITAQVDLLWASALALLAFSFYIVRRLDEPARNSLGRFSIGCIVAIGFSLLGSLVCGYLTYGSCVSLVLKGDEVYLEDARASAAWQAFLFGLGALAFITFCSINLKKVGRAVREPG